MRTYQLLLELQSDLQEAKAVQLTHKKLEPQYELVWKETQKLLNPAIEEQDLPEAENIPNDLLTNLETLKKVQNELDKLQQLKTFFT